MILISSLTSALEEASTSFLNTPLSRTTCLILYLFQWICRTTFSQIEPYYIINMATGSELKSLGLLDVREAARRLSVSTFTLRRYCRSGEISHYRIFGRIKFSVQQIEEFLLNNKNDPESPTSSFLSGLSPHTRKKTQRLIINAISSNSKRI